MTFREAATHPVKDGHCQSCNVIVAYEACERENAQLREQLAASEAELEELIEAAREHRLSVQMTTIDRARVEAEFERLRENLVADAEAMASHGSGTSADTIRDAIDAAHKRLMGGGA